MFCSVLVSFVTVRETMTGLHLMHRFGPLTKRCTVSVQKRNERTQSNFLDTIVMFCSVLVSFVTVRETMPGLHLMHRFGPLTKRYTVLVQKRNKRTQSTFLDPIVMFCSVLVSFVTVRETMPGLHLMHRCGPLTKRYTVSVQKRSERTQSTFLDPIVMFWFILVSFVTVRETMPGLHLMHRFGPLTKRCTVSVQERNERTQSTFLDPVVMFCSVLVSFVSVRETMPGLHLMHRCGPLTKRCTVSVQKGNERTQSTFLDPIVMFCSVLVSFVTVRETMPGLHLMHRFGALTKQCTVSVQKGNERTQSTFLDPIVMFCSVLVSFVAVRKTMPGLPVRPLKKRCTVSVQKGNERTQSTFLDPIVMFCSILVSFVTVRETMPGLHLMHGFGPLSKQCTVSVQKRNERTQSTFLDPIVMFCSVLVSFVAVRKTMPGLPVRPVNETMHSFGPERKRTHPILLFGPNSDVFLRFGQFRYCARNHAGVAFNAPVRPVNETMHSFGPETKRTHPIHLFGPNSDVLLCFGQFRCCAKNHAGVAFNAPV